MVCITAYTLIFHVSFNITQKPSETINPWMEYT